MLPDFKDKAKIKAIGKAMLNLGGMNFSKM